MAEVAATLQRRRKRSQNGRCRKPVGAGLHRLAAVGVAPVLRARAASAVCFGLVIEQPDGLEITVLRGT